MTGTATPPAVAAIVLAGGAGTRLGGLDKPGVVVAGRSLLGSVLSAARRAGTRRAVVVGPHRPRVAGELAASDGVSDGWVRFVTEQPPGGGPVPALRRGLAALTDDDPSRPDPPDEPWVLVLAADLPFLRAHHLHALLRTATGRDTGGSKDAASPAAPGAAGAVDRTGAVFVDDHERPQWLAGCWRTAPLRRAAADYRGTALRGLLAPLNPLPVTCPPQPGQPPPWWDCDTPDDLRRARAWHARWTGRDTIDR